VPLENLTADRQAGSRVTRMIVTELLASGAVDVVEPGEVDAVLAKMPNARGLLSTEQVVALGEALGVQGVLQGTVAFSELSRTGSLAIPVVALDLHLLETETGAAVWASHHIERGGSLGAKLLGTGSEPIAATTRRCVRRSLASLLN
jgi:polysaccharide biosynthesis protein PelC